MRIINQLKLAAIILLLFAFINVILVYYQIDRITNDSRVVNYTGIVRGATQRLVKLALADEEYAEVMKYVDRIVSGLILGDKELSLPKTDDEAYISNMTEVDDQWKELKADIAKIKEYPSHKQKLLEKSEDYFSKTDEAVFSAEAFAKKKVRTLKLVQVVLFLLNLTILAVIWLIVRNITSRLNKTVSSMAGLSTEISTTIEEHEKISTSQSSSMNETTTTMDELNVSSRQSSEQAENAADGTLQALSLTEKGNESVSQMLMGMTILKEKVEAIAGQILNLSEETNRISDITTLVTEFANETKLLAMNAAVEAVRAGEHGKGFSVVAMEIRKLAEESKKSAEKINQAVNDIMKATNSTVMVTEEGTKIVDQGMLFAEKTSQSFNGIQESVSRSTESVQQISLNAKQQAEAIKQVLEAMNALNAGAKESVTGISQTRAGLQKLNETAADLKAMV